MLINEERCTFQVLLEHADEADMLEKAAELNEKMLKHGIMFSFAPSRNQGRKGLTRYTISVIFDKDTISRSAGRKPVECGITMEEAIRLENAGESKAVIAEEMGISLPTYYRKRKKYYEEKQ